MSVAWKRRSVSLRRRFWSKYVFMRCASRLALLDRPIRYPPMWACRSLRCRGVGAVRSPARSPRCSSAVGQGRRAAAVRRDLRWFRNDARCHSRRDPLRGRVSDDSEPPLSGERTTGPRRETFFRRVVSDPCHLLRWSAPLSPKGPVTLAFEAVRNEAGRTIPSGARRARAAPEPASAQPRRWRTALATALAGARGGREGSRSLRVIGEGRRARHCARRIRCGPREADAWAAHALLHSHRSLGPPVSFEPGVFGRLGSAQARRRHPASDDGLPRVRRHGVGSVARVRVRGRARWAHTVRPRPAFPARPVQLPRRRSTVKGRYRAAGDLGSPLGAMRRVSPGPQFRYKWRQAEMAIAACAPQSPLTREGEGRDGTRGRFALGVDKRR